MTDIIQETIWNPTLEGSFDDWFYSLNENEREAVSYYIEHGHKAINATLRLGQVDEMISSLDTALKALKPTTGFMYRGCDFFADEISVGDEFSSRTFYSTSVNPFEAMKFAGKTTPVLFRINGNIGGQVISSYKNEQEILFPRGQKFEITDIERDTTVKLFYPETDYSVSFDNVTLVNMSQK